MRLVSLLLSAALIGWLGYTLVRGHSESGGHSAPKETLDQVQHEVDRIQQDAQKRADEALRRAP